MTMEYCSLHSMRTKSDRCPYEVQCVGSWLAVLQQVVVKDAVIVYFTKSQCEDEIDDCSSLIIFIFDCWNVER